MCTESKPQPWRSDCMCTDRHLHGECQLKLLAQRAEANCPVCLGAYGNVIVTDVPRVRFVSAGGFVCLLFLALVAIGGCAINTWLGLLEPGRSPRTTTVLVCAGVFLNALFIVALATVVWFLRTLGVQNVASSCYRTQRVLAVVRPVML